MQKFSTSPNSSRVELMYRSKYEKRVGQYLTDHEVTYGYEEMSYEYDEPLRKNRSRCTECGSTNLVRTGWYTPDFFIHTGNRTIIIETKGRFTAADRRKMVAIRKEHPDLDIRMLFMRDNRLTRRSATHYSDWCHKNDYTCAVGMPPDAWIKEYTDGQAKEEAHTP